MREVMDLGKFKRNKNNITKTGEWRRKKRKRRKRK